MSRVAPADDGDPDPRDPDPRDLDPRDLDPRDLDPRDIDPDDLPATHLDDDEYDEFLAREFDDDGRLRGEPPVARIIVGLVVVVIALALWLIL